MKGVIVVGDSRTTFCIDCGCHQPFSVRDSREIITVRGLTFSYVESHAYCCNCGAEVYVPEINDANVNSSEEAYREAAGLIRVSEIEQMMKKYSIAAGPLAKLLGFGEVTINRYLSGQLPSRDHSDLLLKVAASYREMDLYLESGRDKIAPVAYQKCRAALDKLSDLYSDHKIELVARYILWRADDITPLALQKLLYYAQAFFYALFGEILFPDPCQAWARGPVYPDIYYKYKDYGYNPIDKPTEQFRESFNELTTREISLLNAVIDIFGAYSGSVLRDITHKERPWLEARGNLLPGDRSCTVIDQNEINAYFRSVVEQYQIINPCDICRYCDAMRMVDRRF